jgi:10 TM Acyl Transferase domain found in Cas1p
MYSVYNEIRVFVSAYVWMTGFGNFLYFDKSQDFTLERAVSMWIRIKLLSTAVVCLFECAVGALLCRSTPHGRILHHHGHVLLVPVSRRTRCCCCDVISIVVVVIMLSLFTWLVSRFARPDCDRHLFGRACCLL